MPQSPDPLSGRLSPAYGLALREFFAHYEVEVLSCVYWRNRAPWSVPTRQVFDSFFLFPVVGHVRVAIGSRRLLIKPRSYLALPDGVRHSLLLEAGHTRLEQVALHCRIQDRWQRPLLARFRSPLVKLPDAPRWYRALADLAALMTTDRELALHRGRVLVSELLIERLRDTTDLAPLKRDGDPRIEHVLQRMKEGLGTTELSIDALAGEISLTATQMRKLFRRETRQGPKQYLHRLRLEKAVRLLRYSTQSVKQVALESGFTTDNYFHLVFRKHFGLTPAAFREREILC